MRSGIAIAGMAGGFWLLGQAVANADTPPPSPAPTTATASGVQTTTDGRGGGGNTQDVVASNTVDNVAKAAPITATGGTSAVGVVAGNANTLTAGSGKSDASAQQNVTTVVWIDSSATGATVTGSGNASAGDNAGASATATGTGTQNTTSTGGSARGGGGGGNSQSVGASNDVDNYARTAPINAGGGTSLVGVLAGNANEVSAGSGHGGNTVLPVSRDGGTKYDRHHESGDVRATQNVHSTVTVHSAATGATVSNSGNASAGDNARYSANATGTQNNRSTGGNSTPRRHHDYDDKWNGKEQDSPARQYGPGGYPHGPDGGGNHQYVDADNTVDNDAITAPINAGGGTSEVEVIAGNGNTLYCTSKTGAVTCSQNITTIINIISQADGATVSCSGNASAGSTGNGVCTQNISGQKPAETETKAVAPAAAPVKVAPVTAAAATAAAPAAHRASTSTSAQTKGQLAYTGSDVSVPLTLGLIALGAGGALSLAGRRRETATV